jgi:hypothetical protein
MGLLTPMIGKRSIISVVVIGFIIGLVGGGFFISPIYEDLPYVAGSFQQLFDGDNEHIIIDVSSTTDLDKFINELKNTKGVISVSYKSFSMSTTNFSKERKEIIKNYMPKFSKNFKSWDVDTNGTIIVNTTDNFDPRKVITNISEWISFTGGIKTNYDLIQLDVNAESGHVDTIISYLESKNVVVNHVEGPVNSVINNTKNSMVNLNVVIFFTGVLGIIIALIGAFLDYIITLLTPIKNIIINRKK